MINRMHAMYVILLIIPILFLQTGCNTNDGKEFAYQDIKQAAEEIPEKTLCRLIYQDLESGKINWADVVKTDHYKLTTPQEIKGFPKLDTSRQKLVQMERIGNKFLVGVRDDSKGEYESGYVLFSSGVEEELHGDHSHWEYGKVPEIIKTVLDKNQGNPAHLYQYGECFYLANDQKNGFTRIDPGYSFNQEQNDSGNGFHAGGGNHITIAVTDKAGYSTWIDGGGPNAGRVDVIPISDSGNGKISYTFKLKDGVIHGATTVEDKVFFAPAEGIAWTVADQSPEKKKNVDEVKINYIELGKDPDGKPLRTGAFDTCMNYVLFVSGQGSYSTFNMIDGKKASPALTQVKIPMKEINSPTTPCSVKAINGKRLAFFFHNHSSEVDGPEYLSVINLDPDQNLNFEDAKVEKEIVVGPSDVNGHFGHHEITFDAPGRYAFWTNPGEGKISMFSLKTMEKVADFPVGGKPTKIIAHGDYDHEH